jgi:hypothetical protein
VDEFASAEKALAVMHDAVEAIGPDDLHRPTGARNTGPLDRLVAFTGRDPLQMNLTAQRFDAASVSDESGTLT